MWQASRRCLLASSFFAVSVGVVAAGQAATTITAPGDLDVRGHGPEPDALMNHYALENSTPFQLLIFRGFCSGNSTVPRWRRRRRLLLDERGLRLGDR